MALEMLLLLSGAIGAGKTSVAKALITSFEFQRISSSEYLRSLISPGEALKGDKERRRLQELGDRLDEETDYLWIVDPVSAGAINDRPDVHNWLIDAVRKERQVEHFRNRFGSVVRHIHLTAPEEVLRERHSTRSGDYDKAIAHLNEVSARNLRKIADQVIDTAKIDPYDIASQIMSSWEVSCAESSSRDHQWEDL